MTPPPSAFENEGAPPIPDPINAESLFTVDEAEGVKESRFLSHGQRSNSPHRTSTVSSFRRQGHREPKRPLQSLPLW